MRVIVQQHAVSRALKDQPESSLVVVCGDDEAVPGDTDTIRKEVLGFGVTRFV